MPRNMLVHGSWDLVDLVVGTQVLFTALGNSQPRRFRYREARKGGKERDGFK